MNIKEKPEVVSRFMKEKGIIYPIVLDADTNVAASYGVRGIPNVLVVDKTGTVRYQGYTLPDAATVKKYL